jgi:DNA-binding transcriptional ArsR family regulator
MGERKHGEPQLDNVFLALSHPTRRQMLDLLQVRSYGGTELAESFDLPLNVVSKHVKSLERAGLLQRDRQGKKYTLCCNTRALAPATRWMERHLRMGQGTLTSFENFIRQSQSTSKPR